MESLKKLIEQRKPTNNYKPPQPEESSKSWVNSYQKDLGLVDSPLEKRAGAPTETIQKALLADRRYSNLPTVGQLKAQAYFSSRRRPTQNPELGGAIRNEEDTERQNPRVGGTELAEEYEQQIEETTLQAIQGQPPAKIANPRGASGSSEIFRTTVGPLKSFRKEQWAWEGIDLNILTQFLEDYNFEQQEATAEYGVSETTYQHRDGRSVILGQEIDSQGIPQATSITIGDQGSTYPISNLTELKNFVVLGLLSVAPKSVSKPGIAHTVIDSKWENQDEIGLGNVTRPQVEGRDKTTPSFSYTEFVPLDRKKKADGHQLVKQQLEKWKK